MITVLRTFQSAAASRISRKRLVGWTVLLAVCAVLPAFGIAFAFRQSPDVEKPVATTPNEPVSRVLDPSETAALLAAEKPKPKPKPAWHPPHVVKVWTTTHKGRMFRVTQLPRCEHVETVIAHDPRGQTLKQAKLRNNGIAACTGSFHNPKSMFLADFLQTNGTIVASARTGRSFVSVDRSGMMDISCAYSSVKGNKDVSALALGQRLVPLQYDGFSKAFMNRVTDRMAIGMNNNFIFIVQGKSDIWRLSHFMRAKLPVTSAVNCDGGHVVRGKGPVHMVFRWKKSGGVANTTTCLNPSQEKKGGS